MSQGALSAYTFSSVTASHTISASFAADTFTIATEPSVNGTITPSSPTVEYGSNQTFLIQPDPGYHVADVLADGASQGAVSSYTFYNVSAAGHTISAVFELDAATVLGVSSAHQPPAAFAARSSRRAVDGFTLARVSGSDPISATGVTVTNSGTSPEANVSGVYVYRDDGNDEFGVPDIALNVTAGSFNSPTATVTFDSPESVGTTPTQYWLVYEFAPLANDGVTTDSRIAEVNAGPIPVDYTVTAGATFTVDAIGPSVAIDAPTNDATLLGASTVISGTASDSGSGVGLVEVSILRSDGKFWTGSDWSATQTWRSAIGTSTWTYGWVLDAEQSGLQTYTISARATDGVGTGGDEALVTGVRVENSTPIEVSDVPPPHVSTGDDTDACAMCHRSHTSASTDTWQSGEASAAQRTSLSVGTGTYDAGMCYSCHGVELLGSGTDIQTPFQSGSGHVLAPDTSPYGPSPKECSDCHDPHGTDHTSGGTPYPALLRSMDASGSPVYQGDVYCVSCHEVRPGSTWDGLGVWRTTAHAGMPGPASGTGIVCSDCHDPHGSPNAPTIAPRVYPPSAPATAAVTANDRTLCVACHAEATATWGGSSLYSSSSHASSNATVGIPGEWPDPDASRKVGECQVCHNPMGEDDGTGRALPKLTRISGENLCYTCHGATGPARTDMRTVAVETTLTSAFEVVASFSAAGDMPDYGRVLYYSQDSSATPPRPLLGARPLRTAAGVGAVAAGDIDGNGRAEILVADSASLQIDVFAYDKLRGVSDRVGPGLLPVAATAEYLAVGDVLLDSWGLPEVVMIDRGANELYVYRYAAATWTLVDGPIAVGNVSGMTIGDVTGTSQADVVLTVHGPDRVVVLSEDSGHLLESSVFGARAGVRGPSIGDVLSEPGNEIVVANADETSDTVSVYRADGTTLGHLNGDELPGQRATASAIGDVLPEVPGPEVLVSYADPLAGSRLDVFSLDATTGVGTVVGYDAGERFNPAAIAVGDVNGDGHSEALLANAGAFTRDGSRERASVSVFRANGTGDGLVGPQILSGGGAELASGTVQVAIADVGATPQTGHPIGAVPDTHVSTETFTLARHVECVDCHSHDADSADASAPVVFGALKGAWGVAVQNQSSAAYDLTQQQGVRYEYELCLKCHSQWSALEGSADLASLVNTRNASVHAIEEPSADASIPAGSFQDGWSDDSALYCTSCHGNSNPSEPAGPHRSGEAPILVRPYWGVAPDDAAGLCYECHRYAVYLTGAEDTLADPKSAFYLSTGSGSTGQEALHSYHADTLGFACGSCHVSHGSRQELHLLRSDIGYTPDASGGSCANQCHGTGGATRSYLRP